MPLDYKNLKDAKLEDLHAESQALSQKLSDGRSVLKLVNDEITIRENLDTRVKGIENVSDEELERMLAERKSRREKAQSISDAGGVESGEKVVGTKSVDPQ